MSSELNRYWPTIRPLSRCQPSVRPLERYQQCWLSDHWPYSTEQWKIQGSEIQSENTQTTGNPEKTARKTTRQTWRKIPLTFHALVLSDFKPTNTRCQTLKFEPLTDFAYSNTCRLIECHFRYDRYKISKGFKQKKWSWRWLKVIDSTGLVPFNRLHYDFLLALHAVFPIDIITYLSKF